MTYDVTPIAGPQEGVEVDLTDPAAGAWSIRLTRCRRTGAVALIAMDHASGTVALAHVLRPPTEAQPCR